MPQQEWLRSRSFPGVCAEQEWRFQASHLSSTQLKNSSQVANVKKAAKDGYTRISGDSSFSKFARTNRIRAAKASRMPMTPQRIQDGKNDPRMFREGAREQPVSNTIAAMHDCSVRFVSRDLSVKQIAGLVGQSGQGS